MKFEIHGPFEVPLDGTVQVNTQVRADFANIIGASHRGNKTLADACGCYVFAIRAGKGILPWYVGKSERSSFRQECLTDRNINIYNNLLKNRAGTPLMYLVSQLTGKAGKFASPTSQKNPSASPIDFLESMLIGMALTRNPDIENIHKTKMLRELEVIGFMNTSRLARSGAAAELRKVVLRLQ